MGVLPSRGPVVLHPALEQAQHVDPLVQAAQFGELAHALLVVAQQELLRGAEAHGGLRAVLQQGQLVVAHAPAAGEVLPVLDRAVGRVQLLLQPLEQVAVVHQVADHGRRGWETALLTRAVQVLQVLCEAWRSDRCYRQGSGGILVFFVSRIQEEYHLIEMQGNVQYICKKEYVNVNNNALQKFADHTSY